MFDCTGYVGVFLLRCGGERYLGMLVLHSKSFE